MICLVELNYTDKESQAIYSTYTSNDAVIADIETKLGQAMKSDAIKAIYLLAFDHTGKIIDSKYHSKDDTVTFADRLVWIESDAEGEHPNMQKYDSALDAEANYHTKRGAAMKNDSVLAIMTMILNSASVGMCEYWVRSIEVEPEPEPEPEV